MPIINPDNMSVYLDISQVRFVEKHYLLLYICCGLLSFLAQNDACFNEVGIVKMTNEENILFQRDLEARRCVQYDRETA